MFEQSASGVADCHFGAAGGRTAARPHPTAIPYLLHPAEKRLDRRAVEPVCARILQPRPIESFVTTERRRSPMKKHTLVALIVGVLAVTALGVWWGPSLMDRDTESPRHRRRPFAGSRDREATTRAGRALRPPRRTRRRRRSRPTSSPRCRRRSRSCRRGSSRSSIAAPGWTWPPKGSVTRHSSQRRACRPQHGRPVRRLKHRVLEEKRTLARAIGRRSPISMPNTRPRVRTTPHASTSPSSRAETLRVARGRSAGAATNGRGRLAGSERSTTALVAL